MTNLTANIKTVGLLGAGQMGSDICQLCALRGYQVYLHDLSQERIEGAIASIGKGLARQAAKGEITRQACEEALARVQSAPRLGGLADCDLVIEAVPEEEAVKRQLFEELGPLLKAEAILASNTSSLSITRLASFSGRPEKFVGIHFMNPATSMKLVELIRGIATQDETFERAKAFAESLGKTIVEAEDFPAFIVNRILLVMINEAICALYQGAGSIKAIDKAMRLGGNHPMGPLELADFIGLDTCLSIMQVLHKGLADDKYRPCPLLEKYVQANWLGRKTKRGFYDYCTSPPTPTR